MDLSSLAVELLAQPFVPLGFRRFGAALGVLGEGVDGFEVESRQRSAAAGERAASQS
jgi:hypothetical protein